MTKKIALFIDADNISAKFGKQVIETLERHGEIFIRRIYGNWEKISLHSWNDCILNFSLRAIQQPDYVAGKNATDMSLLIDAMDILYGGKAEIFALVSNDSDFTPLAIRLREGGMKIIGMGNSNAANSFRMACDEFIDLDAPAEIKIHAAQKETPEKNSAVQMNLFATEKKIEPVRVQSVTAEKKIEPVRVQSVTAEKKIEPVRVQSVTAEKKIEPVRVQSVTAEKKIEPVRVQSVTAEKKIEPVRVQSVTAEKKIEPVRVQSVTAEKKIEPVRVQPVTAKKKVEPVRVQSVTAKKKVEPVRVQSVTAKKKVEPPPIKPVEKIPAPVVINPKVVPINGENLQCERSKRFQKLHKLLRDAAEAHCDETGFVNLSYAGSGTGKKKLGFGIKDLGYSSLKSFVADFPSFYEVRKVDKAIYYRYLPEEPKTVADRIQRLHDILREIAKIYGDEQGFFLLNSADIELRNRKISFDVRNLGYSTLHRFVMAFQKIYEVHRKGDVIRYRCLKNIPKSSAEKRQQQIHKILRETAKVQSDEKGFVNLGSAGTVMAQKKLTLKGSGHNKLSKFISAFPELYEVQNSGQGFCYRCKK